MVPARQHNKPVRRGHLRWHLLIAFLAVAASSVLARAPDKRPRPRRTDPLDRSPGEKLILLAYRGDLAGMGELGRGTDNLMHENWLLLFAGLSVRGVLKHLETVRVEADD